jgi:paraquat-inducible protein B
MGETLAGINRLVNSQETQGIPADVDRLVRSMNATVSSFRDLAMSVDSTVGPMRHRLEAAAEQAETSMAEVQVTLESMRSMMDPNAPLVVSLVRTLEELELTAQSLRRVVELVERNPAVLLRGRDTGGGS